MTGARVADATTIPLNTISDSSSHRALTPDFTPSSTPLRERQEAAVVPATMEQAKATGESSVKEEIHINKEEGGEAKVEARKDQKTQTIPEVKAPRPCKKHARCHKSKKGKKEAASESEDSSNSSSSSESASESEGEDESESSSSEDEGAARRRRKKAKRKQRSRKDKRKTRRAPSSEDDSADSEDASSDEDPPPRSTKRRGGKKPRRGRRAVSPDADSSDDSDASTSAALRALELQRLKRRSARAAAEKKKAKRKGKHARRSGKPQYFRGDELWDREIHAYKLTATAEAVEDDEYGDYAFHVRRRFDWEGKYSDTVVDIKSKVLRSVLQHVMGNCKAVSLAEDTPTVDPNMLFIYLEDIRTFKKELRHKADSEKKKKLRKQAAEQCAQAKLLLKYLDKDYASTKKTLYPLLEAGNITFDLIWTLFRSDSILYTSTYSAPDEPRAFKVEYATKESSFMRGTWYDIEGKYLDYDGKSFGLGTMNVEIESFKGPRRINSLPCYPLKYHKDPEGIKKTLIERGRKFTDLAGMQYKFHKGLGFMKRKRQVIKVTINGRIMVDPSTFRRINPNYPISTVKPADPDLLEEPQDSDDEDCCCCSDNDDQPPQNRGILDEASCQPAPTRRKVVLDRQGDVHLVEVEVDENGQEIQKEKMDTIAGDNGDADAAREFNEEELLIASPVVLGFAFSEKMWLEFTVSGVHAIEWNAGAFDSLVLPDNQKSIVKALVQSHTSEAQQQKNIDDVIQGKGKGLVAVLHGTPGVGKTLTAEGIAELLHCPLYCVSAGELGTNPRDLEQELTKILDVAHCWGAVLLLDEADVFLEARTPQDIHRNALVSIFLRLLEYFQGFSPPVTFACLLFLTTNRVATFDDAFQSRIHIAIRYQELDYKARLAVWRLFISKVVQHDQIFAESSSTKAPAKTTETAVTAPTSSNATASKPSEAASSTSSTSSPSKPSTPSKTSSPSKFTDTDFDRLARRGNLNGRQIKNSVRSAQALAVNEGVPISMSHILRVLEVSEAFSNDLKGGSGFTDAMRSYV